jgi:hypothetical protein
MKPKELRLLDEDPMAAMTMTPEQRRVMMNSVLLKSLLVLGVVTGTVVTMELILLSLVFGLVT